MLRWGQAGQIARSPCRAQSVANQPRSGWVLAAEASFYPRYETTEPNGRGCGEHVFASASLVVP